MSSFNSLIVSDTIKKSGAREFVIKATVQCMRRGVQYDLIPRGKSLWFNRDLLTQCIEAAFPYYEDPEELHFCMSFDYETGLTQILCGIEGVDGLLISSKILICENFLFSLQQELSLNEHK